jgi:hypothetical protein
MGQTPFPIVFCHSNGFHLHIIDIGIARIVYLIVLRALHKLHV